MKIKKIIFVGATLLSVTSLSAVTNAAETSANNSVTQSISQDYQEMKKSATTHTEHLKDDAKQAWHKAEAKTDAAGNTIKKDSHTVDTGAKDKFIEAKDATKHTYDKNKHAIEKTTNEGKKYTAETWDKTKAETASKWDKSKDYTADKWGKSKEYTKEKTGEIKKGMDHQVDSLKQTFTP
ncbi:hypothetical protein I2F17_01985 [Acinetobacter sp. B10A]|uniref:hypothetical protein n=1 Tax=Acinetobacter baretiae TaxID=2605383 RepID=UPI001B3C7A52|nr:hypothetical protein [Acinetobacter baretiae]MBF7684603.1 hypothetical protein [Acinetobacter baretiae]